MKTSNIIIFLPSLSGGGAEKVIISLFENLNRINYNVTLVVQNKIGPLKINIEDKSVIDLKTKNFRYALPKIIRIIRVIKPDIIISTFPHITLPLILLKKIFYRKSKIVARIPNMVEQSLSDNAYLKLLKYFHNKLMLKANKIIVTSIAMKNDFIKRGINKDKLFLIHNPINVSSLRKIKNIYRFPGKGLRFVIVGRLSYQKGIDRIIPILNNIDNCHLTIIGEGTEKNKILKSILYYKVKDKIKFLNFSNIANSYIAGADFLLLPSRWEGLPNVALESLVLGTPVLCFKEIDGLNDLIPLVPDNALKFCINVADMEKILKSSNYRQDYLVPQIRKNLLNTFNTPELYANKLEIMMKGLIFEK